MTDNGELLVSAVKIMMDLYKLENQSLVLTQLIECNRICRAIHEEKTKGPQ